MNFCSTSQESLIKAYEDEKSNSITLPAYSRSSSCRGSETDSAETDLNTKIIRIEDPLLDAVWAQGGEPVTFLGHIPTSGCGLLFLPVPSPPCLGGLMLLLCLVILPVCAQAYGHPESLKERGKRAPKPSATQIMKG